MNEVVENTVATTDVVPAEAVTFRHFIVNDDGTETEVDAPDIFVQDKEYSEDPAGN